MILANSLLIGTTNGLFVEDLSSGEVKLLGFNHDGSEERRAEFNRNYSRAIRSPVVVDAKVPNRMFVASAHDGVFCSSDFGKSWSEINNGIVSKEVWCVAQHPVTGYLFASTAPVAAYRSTDDGKTWDGLDGLHAIPTRKEWFLHTAPYYPRLRNLSFSSDSEDLIVGAIEEGWVVRSTDEGVTWTNDHVGIGVDAHEAIVAPGDPAVILVSTFKGICRSVDGGRSYQSCEDVPIYAMSLACHVLAPGLAYASGSSEHSSGSGNVVLYCSDNFGKSWASLIAPPTVERDSRPRALGIDPENPDRFAVGLVNGRVYVSEDGGQTLEQVVSGLPKVTSLTWISR